MDNLHEKLNLHEMLKPDSLIGGISESEEMLHQRVNSKIGDVFNDEIKMASPDFIIQKIQELNPEVEIRIDPDRSIIFSSVSIEELVLPEGFYYDKNNLITNKRNTQSGNYGDVCVYPIEYYELEI